MPKGVPRRSPYARLAGPIPCDGGGLNFPTVKRFTETEKWRDSWFRKLKATTKLAFLYIVDNCDAAGVWDPDFELANFTIGEEISWLSVLEQLGDRIDLLKNGKWHITRFVEFQYGELVDECRPHAKVLQILKGHGIPYRKGINRVSILNRTGQDNTGQGKEEEERPSVAEQIYAAYPRKEARQDAIRAIEKVLLKYPSDRLLSATKAYAAAVSGWIPEDKKFIPHPATWFNGGRYEDDPLTWARSAPQPAAPEFRPPANMR